MFVSGIFISEIDAGVTTWTGSFFTKLAVSMKKSKQQHSYIAHGCHVDEHIFFLNFSSTHSRIFFVKPLFFSARGRFRTGSMSSGKSLYNGETYFVKTICQFVYLISIVVVGNNGQCTRQDTKRCVN